MGPYADADQQQLIRSTELQYALYPQVGVPCTFIVADATPLRPAPVRLSNILELYLN